MISEVNDYAVCFHFWPYSNDDVLVGFLWDVYKRQTNLVAKLVDEARSNNIKIIPLCPFVKKEFENKKEYADVLA